eukprot:643151-Amphidinium_carterae.1
MEDLPADESLAICPKYVPIVSIVHWKGLYARMCSFQNPRKQRECLQSGKLTSGHLPESGLRCLAKRLKTIT